ncbi:SufS family cysteine desulfurase [Candidatus Micrarchaeota archaeon]|nr:SufS family cysteine desulfurase [Candidatus Micrarchaeota archaeon]
MNIEKIRKDFPILETVVYLDSAATTQKPIQVIDEICDFYKKRNSNIARGLYTLAEEATMSYEATREKTAAFINSNPNEVIFTKNTTEGCNLVMRGYEKFIRKKIVVTAMDHHSNFVPWQVLAQKTGAEFQVVDITDEGLLDQADLEKKIKGADFVAVSAASNVLGTKNDVRKISAMAHDEGAVCFVDGAQYVPSNKTDVKDIGCDFLGFSGHKMLAPFGVGVLYGKEELLEKMDPFFYGSEMIREVTKEKSTWNSIPHKFESGTPNPEAVAGLSVAIDYLEKIGFDGIQEYEKKLTAYMLKRLGEVEALDILGPMDVNKRGPLAAFTLDNVHPHDVAAILNEDNICVRSGHHCAMPLHNRLKIVASTRASLYIYNKKEEIDLLAESLGKAKKLFK